MAKWVRSVCDCWRFFIALAMTLSSVPAWAGEEQSERFYSRGLIPFQEERYEEALALFQQAAAEEPPYYLGVYYLGVTLGKLGRYAEALPPLEKTLRLQPEFARARLDLAVAFYHLQRYQEALNQLRALEVVEPHNGLAQYYKGLSHYQLKTYDAAVLPLQHAAEREPLVRARSYYYLGLAYLFQVKPDDAARALRQAIDAAPDSEVAARARITLRAIETQARNRRATKPWEVRLGVGTGYDSNVILEPNHGLGFPRISDRDDVRFTLSLGGTLDLWRSRSTSLWTSYDFYQSLYTDIDDFDVQAHLFRLNGSWSPSQSLTVGMEGSSNYFRVGDRSYLHQLSAMPYLGFFAAPWAYTSVSYRLTNQNYLISFFDPARDGWHWEAAVRQYVLLNEFSQYIFFGYQHDRDLPSLSVGNDFQYHAHQFEVGVRTPLLRDMSTELTYFFRDENYTFANSRTNFTKARSDNTHSLFFLVRKPLTPYLDVTVSYIATFNDSNIDDFQYDRHIISLGLQLAY